MLGGARVAAGHVRRQGSRDIPASIQPRPAAKNAPAGQAVDMDVAAQGHGPERGVATAGAASRRAMGT